MKLVSYGWEPSFTDAQGVKELRGVYVVPSGENVVGVGEAARRYRERG